MDHNMKIDIKILNELKRYNQINKYIMEQDAGAELPPPPADPTADPAAAIPPPPGGDPAAAIPPPADPLAAGTPPADPLAAGAEGGAIPEPIDVSSDPDVEKLDDKKENKKELEITDLVKAQKKIENRQEEYFDKLFNHIDKLESKLSEMDNIVNKLNDLESKVEKYRTKTPEEKLKLRSLDSGPFDQTLSQYFEDKEDEFDKLGRDEYILTKDEVEDYSPSDIKKSFRNFEDFDQPDNFKRIS
jgi:hypothetical protein